MSFPSSVLKNRTFHPTGGLAGHKSFTAPWRCGGGGSEINVFLWWPTYQTAPAAGITVFTRWRIDTLQQSIVISQLQFSPVRHGLCWCGRSGKTVLQRSYLVNTADRMLCCIGRKCRRSGVHILAIAWLFRRIWAIPFRTGDMLRNGHGSVVAGSMSPYNNSSSVLLSLASSAWKNLSPWPPGDRPTLSRNRLLLWPRWRS